VNLFDKKPDKLEGFDAFWALFPRDKRRSGRKSGKSECKRIWKKVELYKSWEQVLAALKEDIKDIAKGSYASGEDRMCYFPGIKPWLNQEKYDRDEPEPTPAPTLVSHIPKSFHKKCMTRLEFESNKDHFRKLAGFKP
jgi:hypothetical protein